MWEVFEEEIERKARSILAKQGREDAGAQKYAKRFSRRTGIASTAAPYKEPPYWQYDNQFNPVYCIAHARFLAKRIWSKIQSGLYEPKPAILFEIPKPEGGTRGIMLFSIPDAAVANVFHRRLTMRNKGLFSSYSFAYRPDRNIFEAIIHLQRMLQPSKTYILKYDYSKYFDTIDHTYLDKLIARKLFIMTGAERTVIGAFLRHKYSTYPSWQAGKHTARTLGVPQGRERSRMIVKQGGLPSYSISDSELLSGSWHQSSVANETTLPSFVRGWRAARKFYKRYGLSELKAPTYYSLLSSY